MSNVSVKLSRSRQKDKRVINPYEHPTSSSFDRPNTDMSPQIPLTNYDIPKRNSNFMRMNINSQDRQVPDGNRSVNLPQIIKSQKMAPRNGT